MHDGRWWWQRGALFGALALAVAVPGTAVHADLVTDAKGFVSLKPGDEVWTDYPGIQGIKIMYVEGRPNQPGPYVIRVKFAPGTMSMPHTHPEDRLVTVIKGTWFTGTSGEFEPWDTLPLPAGSFMKHPAGKPHYDGAKDEEVIVQIAGIGPSGTAFIRPELPNSGNGLLKKP
jgi:quercetin dioxygenase-like cupin family protein